MNSFNILIQVSQNFSMSIISPNKILLYLSLCAFLYSCNPSPENQAVQWSQDIKDQIKKDAFSAYNNIVKDSANGELRSVLYLNGDTKLREYKFIKGDTGVSVFYSKSQDFELIKEFCPAASRTFEGIKYKGNWTGVTEYRYCDGSIKEREITVNGLNIGISEEFDKNGVLIKSFNNQNTSEIENLKKIKYE